VKTIEAVRADAVDLTTYGRLYDLAGGGEPDVVFTQAADWRDRYTGDPVVTGAAHLGMTAGPAVTSEVRLMEQHRHTTEAIAPIAAPIVVPVGAQPHARAVQALLLRPGQCLMLHPGVYHAPAMGLDGPSLYYWLAAVDQTITDAWHEIVDGPLWIRVRGHHA
jgi:hypothetical protein